jgi:3-hydroxyacyl-CoA dehydrogenase
MNKAACVGVGLIGSSWAALLAWKGLTVYIHDLNIEITKRALNEIHKILKLLTDLYGSEPKGEVIISKTLEEAVEDVEYVQESVVEDLKVKKDLFEKIDNISKHEAIIASSTSGLRISEIQRAVRNYPERCLIVHPFNPPHLMPLVEVVPGPETSRGVVGKVVDFMKKLGKNPLSLRRMCQEWSPIDFKRLYGGKP